MSERQVTDGGVLGARVVASVGRVRCVAHFHRDNDRKLGGGIQGLECCELFEGLGEEERFSGGCESLGAEGMVPASSASETEECPYKSTVLQEH
jgi:hypothetical protein